MFGAGSCPKFQNVHPFGCEIVAEIRGKTASKSAPSAAQNSCLLRTKIRAQTGAKIAPKPARKCCPAAFLFVFTVGWKAPNTDPRKMPWWRRTGSLFVDRWCGGVLVLILDWPVAIGRQTRSEFLLSCFFKTFCPRCCSLPWGPFGPLPNTPLAAPKNTTCKAPWAHVWFQIMEPPEQKGGAHYAVPGPTLRRAPFLFFGKSAEHFSEN